MPQLSVSSYISRPLTDYYISVQQEEDGFVAGRVAPVLPVNKKYDKYYIVPPGGFNRDEMKPRSPHGEAHSVRMQLSDDTFDCSEWALKVPIADEEDAQLEGEAIDPETLAVDYLAQQALIRKEKIFASKFLATSVWTGQLQGKAATPSTNEFLQWNDGSSNPVTDIKLAMRAFRDRTGLRATSAVVTADVWDTLELHPDIIGLVSGGATTTVPALVNPDIVARILGLQKLHVMEAIENTAGEGLAQSTAKIASKKMLIYRSAPAGRKIASAMTWFGWRGKRREFGSTGEVIYRHAWSSKTRTREIESAMYVDAKVTAADLGTLLYDVIA